MITLSSPQLSAQLTGSPRIIICCSGRGDKEVHTVAQFLNAT